MDSFKNKEILSEEDQEIDFDHIVNLLLHNKFYISLFTSIGVLFSIIFALMQNKIWQGQFQIVLSKPEESKISKFANSNNLISNILDVGGVNNLDTEVEILKSPSVLLPIFNYVKDFKLKNGEKLNNWKYQDWSENSLELDLVKGTNVLNIIYQDTDIEIIPDVLKKISNAYQSYSERNRQRSISNTINYLEKQVSIYKSKSKESLRAYQEYGIEKDLSLLVIDGKGQKNNNIEILDTINVERIRINAADKIRKINVQLEQLKDIGDDENKIIYLGSSIEGIVESQLLADIDSIDKELTRKKLNFKDNDKSITLLNKKRSGFVKLLKEKILAYLSSELFSANSLLKSAERPKEVLIKYKELLREAIRDEKALQSIESDLALVNLEKERIQYPWELITDLAVLENPVYPNKRKIVFIGTFLSFLFSSFVFFIKNIKYKVIFSSRIIQRYFPSKLIQISIDEGNEYIEEIKLITKGSLFDNKKEKIAVVQVGFVDDDFSTKFLNVLKEQIKVKEFLLLRRFFELSKVDSIILLSQKGKVSKLDLDIIKNKLSFQEVKIIANIFVDMYKKEQRLSFSKIKSFFN